MADRDLYPYWYERAMTEGREHGYVTVTGEELDELERKVPRQQLEDYIASWKDGVLIDHPSPKVNMMLFGWPLHVRYDVDGEALAQVAKWFERAKAEQEEFGFVTVTRSEFLDLLTLGSYLGNGLLAVDQSSPDLRQTQFTLLGVPMEVADEG